MSTLKRIVTTIIVVMCVCEFLALTLAEAVQISVGQLTVLLNRDSLMYMLKSKTVFLMLVYDFLHWSRLLRDLWEGSLHFVPSESLHMVIH